MPPATFSPGRRRVLAGLGALAAAPAVLTVAGTATGTAAPAAAADDFDYECMADLVETGEVTRADLVAR
ncbi:hypothetical protein [Nocardioides marinquilinus]